MASPKFSTFSIVPSIVMTPPISYCNDCGGVVVQSMQNSHVCAFWKAN